MKYSRIISAIIGIILIALGVGIIYSEWESINTVLLQADYSLILVAFIWMFVAYILLVSGFVLIHRIFNYKLNTMELSLIGYTTATVNHLMALASLGGYSLRIFLLKQRGYQAKDSLTVSVFHSYFHNFIFLFLFPIIALYIFIYFSIEVYLAWILILTSLISIGTLLLVTGIIFHQKTREKIANLIYSIYRILKINEKKHDLDILESNFDKGVVIIKSKFNKTLFLAIVVLLEWTATIFIMNTAFMAFGYSISLPVLLIGFLTGTAIGLISMLPGGIGAQEGAMTTSFVLLGVPFEQAFLAPIFFRLIYFVIPSLIGLILYWGLLKKVSTSKKTRKVFR